MENKNIIPEDLIDEEFVLSHIATLELGLGIRFAYSRRFLDLLQVFIQSKYRHSKIDITISDKIMTIRLKDLIL